MKKTCDHCGTKLVRVRGFGIERHTFCPKCDVPAPKPEQERVPAIVGMFCEML